MNVRVIAFVVSLAAGFPGSLLADDSRPSDQSTPPPVVVRVSQGGFRWGDAAVGAAGASGIALALHGASLFRRQLKEEKQ